jgi:Tol biopolymer transport system component
MIAYWGSPGIFVIRRDRRGGWSAPEMLHDSLGPPSWTPDGKGLLTYSRLDQIIRLDVATRRLDTLYTRGTAGPRVNRPIMSSDGRTIYFKDRDAVASFWAMPAQGGTPRRVLRFDQRRPSYRLEYWTDGRYLYFTIDERHSDLWLLELARSDRAQAH